MVSLEHFFFVELHESNAFLRDWLVQGNKEVRSRSSAHHRFGYLLFFLFC